VEPHTTGSSINRCTRSISAGERTNDSVTRSTRIRSAIDERRRPVHKGGPAE
jgi:hypothetical protein